jgi:Uma2 family endonuclease
MPETAVEAVSVVEVPDISQIVTEDDTPVDNLFSEKQQRLLVEPLYGSWDAGRPFLASSNVGVFSAVHRPPVVPDMFLSLDVHAAEDLWAKQHRSYFLWEFGKPPDVVVEVVSNTEGGETDRKLYEYARMGVRYYVIYDPQGLVQEESVRVYELHVGEYFPKRDWWLEKVGLGVTIWEGKFEEQEDRWLRWCDQEGEVIPTGAERAEWERERVEQERERANQERERAERLAAQLRALGVSPEV